MPEVRRRPSTSQGCHIFSHFPLTNTSLYKSSLNQDCCRLYSCKIRHVSVRWKSQKRKKKNPEGKTPTYMTHDLKYHWSHQPLSTPHTHLASSSVSAFVSLHPYQPFSFNFFFTFIITISSTPKQKPLRNKKGFLKNLK